MNTYTDKYGEQWCYYGYGLIKRLSDSNIGLWLDGEGLE